MDGCYYLLQFLSKEYATFICSTQLSKSMSANNLYAQIIINFQASLDSLKDHPDVEKINFVATLANADPTNLSLCQDFAYICIEKLKNVNTPSTYKKPILYAIDALLKKVPGGPYPLIFARLFAENGAAILRDIPNHEKQKIDFMFGTWGERNYFSLELLQGLKDILRRGMAVVTPVTTIQPQSYVQPFTVQPQSQPRLFYGSEDATFQLAVHNEMISLLNQLYSSINATNPLSLEQIQIQDPSLYEELRKNAIESVSQLLMNTRSTTVSSSRAGASRTNIGTRAVVNTVGQKRGQTSSSLAPNKRTDTGRSRSAPAPPSLVIPGNTSRLQSSSGTSSLDQPAGQCVKGYICEKEVVVDVDRTKYLTNNLMALCSYDDLSVLTPNIRNMLLQFIPRMQNYLDNVMKPPPLPRFLNGPLPPEPLFNKVRGSKIPGGALPTEDGFEGPIKKPLPIFRVDDRELRESHPEFARSLYSDRPFQHQEDGLRFKTEQQLLYHKEKYMKTTEFLRKNKTSSRQSRQWYCTVDQWITEFDSLTTNKHGSITAESQNNAVALEQFVVPVDEDFPRCPISGEPFVRSEDEDGEELYRDAVKVLVTPRTPHIFEKSHPLGHMMDDIDSMRYMIVHKSLVMDNWLREGKSTTLEEVFKHPSCCGLSRELLKKAATDEQDDDEIFVMVR